MVEKRWPRTVTIPADRLEAWVANFTARHGEPLITPFPDVLELGSPDGAGARIAVPFPPLVDPDTGLAGLRAHLQTPRRVGALLIRKGGHAVGVFEDGVLVTSKVGSAYVQGRTKAGGWSQQRYARRRDNQSTKAYAEAAEEVVRLLVPEQDRLDAVVTGGDRVGVTAVLADPRVRGLLPLVTERLLDVPDPRLRVLQALPTLYATLVIGLNDRA